jgi:sialic acid synthase SpsE
VLIGDKAIGSGHPCFICFEAGPTHNGLESAMRLIKCAADAGADAIKFQIFDPDRLIADRSVPFTYQVLIDRETGQKKDVTEPLYDIFVRRALTDQEWRELKNYSDTQGLSFFATIGDLESLELVQSMSVDSVKIASADVNHLPLIRAVARTGLSVQLDTGSASFGEIEVAVDTIHAEGNDKIIIHNCPSGYPARLSSINLKMLQTLKDLFSCPVAYSDHSPGIEMDIAAVALGADLIEKTITEDRTTPSVEHIMSIEPFEMLELVKVVREVETAMGDTRRILSPAENDQRLAVRRSVYLAEPGKAGQRLRDVAVDFRRPGFGIGPDMYETLLENRLKHDLQVGHALRIDDLDHG